MAGDGEGVGGEAGLHLGVVEVDHGAVVLDHVDLLNARDVVNWKRIGLEIKSNKNSYQVQFFDVTFGLQNKS